jgi:uncharacterized protein (DUF2235 family)
LVVCCDGTWNRPDQRTHGIVTPTNVWKVYSMLDRTGRDGVRQVRYYNRGVGTGYLDRVRGGAFGWGLSKNVKAAYQFVVENYEVGDELFLLGFSRGAFTARSTAGLIRNVGILKDAPAGRDSTDACLRTRERIEEGYTIYRSKEEPDGPKARAFRAAHSWPGEVRIRFLGVWDTVGSLGIPLPGPFRLLNRRWGFHDVRLSSRVAVARQALALDERRGPFEPTLWEPSKTPAPGQSVKQVWFAGVHSDVGGGYAETGLADLTLCWMAREAAACGLGFRAGAFTSLASPRRPRPGDASAGLAEGWYTRPDAAGTLHDSYTGFYRLLPQFRRRVDLGGLAASVASSLRDRPALVPGYEPLERRLVGGPLSDAQVESVGDCP